ncbi:hypothetical protein BJ912DRAFT_1112207, partial [Pholiota molesta]
LFVLPSTLLLFVILCCIINLNIVLFSANYVTVQNWRAFVFPGPKPPGRKEPLSSSPPDLIHSAPSPHSVTTSLSTKTPTPHLPFSHSWSLQEDASSAWKSGPVRSFALKGLGPGPRPVHPFPKSAKNRTGPMRTGPYRSFAVQRPVKTGHGSDQSRPALDWSRPVLLGHLSVSMPQELQYCSSLVHGDGVVSLAALGAEAVMLGGAVLSAHRAPASRSVDCIGWRQTGKRAVRGRRWRSLSAHRSPTASTWTPADRAVRGAPAAPTGVVVGGGWVVGGDVAGVVGGDVAGVVGGHAWVTWRVSVDVVGVVAANAGHGEQGAASPGGGCRAEAR